MNAADVVIGLVLILILFWNIMMVVEQRNLSASIAALEFAQRSSFLFSPKAVCPVLDGYALAEAKDLQQKEYKIVPGMNADTNQMYLCFYETAAE